MQSSAHAQAAVGQEVWPLPPSLNNGDSSEEEGTEEEEHEDEQLNLRMFGIHQALPIPDGEPDWEAGPPDTAEEYLRRVRAEAAACPRVVRVEFDAEAYAAKQRTRAAAQSSSGASPRELLHHKTNSTGSAPRTAAYVSRLVAAGTLQEGPAWSKPSYHWVRQLVSDFRSMRQWLTLATQQHTAELSKVKLPPVHDTDAWALITAGELPTRPAEQSSTATLQLSVANPPAASRGPSQQPNTQQASDQAALDSVQGAPAQAEAGTQATSGQDGDTSKEQGSLTSMNELSGPVLSTVLCIDQITVSALIQRLVSKVQDSPQLSELDSQWLFALGAVLEKPAHSDVVAAFRSLTRWLAQQRSGLVDATDAQLPRINTLAVVAGAYFGQDETLVPWVSDMELP